MSLRNPACNSCPQPRVRPRRCRPHLQRARQHRRTHLHASTDRPQGLTWELIFVDDDSPDDTAAVIAEYARRDRRIRLIHRVGRRGLSSACIEGMLATTANYVAVMDADMQHDETILPQMLATLREGSLDIVVGTRNAEGGSMGEFGRHRVLLSRMGQKVSNAVCRCDVTDPMSGFFLCRRSFFLEVVRHLNGGGFKILVDMLASADRPVRLAEVGYTFRARTHGESKLDVNTAVEYLFLVLDKLTDEFTAVHFPCASPPSSWSALPALPRTSPASLC